MKIKYKTKLKFKINYYYFVFNLLDNFSCWDVHCRTHLKELLPEFYKLVSENLPAYANLRKTKYGWKTIEKFFLYDSEQDIDLTIRSNIACEDAELILTPFRKLANNRLVKIYWYDNMKFIETYTKLLEILWAKWSERAYKIIINFFEVELPTEISVFVVLNERGAGGGSNLSGKGITLELGSTNIAPGNILEILMHEIIHFVSNSKTIRLLVENGAPEPNIIEEAIVSLLASNSGLISSKIKLSKGDIMPLPNDVTTYKQKIKELVAARLEKNDESYESFIKNIADALK